MRNFLSVIPCIAMSVGVATAQTTVSGVVTSVEDGLPVIGASVVGLGVTGLGTVTDYEGKFELTVEDGVKQLVISYVGMKDAIVDVAPNVVVALHSDTEQLDEVMVVAYGTAKKSSFTGSAQTIGSDDVASQSGSIVQSLEGKVAGVKIGTSSGDPGANQEVVIRGISSISASTEPLYVVDGVPVVNSGVSSGLKSQSVLSSINPDDIESMTILKDAAAASLYGSRAANGVIIITTKLGKQGKSTVTYSGEVGISQMAVRDQYNTMSAADMIEYYNYGFANRAAVDPATGEYWSEQYLGKPLGDDLYSFGEGMVKYMGYFADPTGKTNTNWKDEIYKNGFKHDHQLSVRGGSEKTRFYTGVGYNKTEGIVTGSDFERYSGRVNIEHDVTDWLKLGVRQMISYTKTNGFRDQNNQAQGIGMTSPLSILFSMDPTAVNKLEDGSYNPNAGLTANISNPNLMLGQTTGENAETLSSDLFRNMTNADVTVKLPFDLTARTLFGYDYVSNKDKEFWAPGSVNGSSVGGLGYRLNAINQTITSSTTLGYVKDLGNHSLNVLAGYEVEDKTVAVESMSANGYWTDKLPELSNGQPDGVSTWVDEASIMSFLSSASYDYADKYYASASFRRDGSSRLGVNNRWANFWSVSGAWRLTGEEWLQDKPLFTDLKLRASYGTNGNLPGDYFANMALYSSDGYGEEAAIYWASQANPDLSWERSSNFNVGFDWNMYGRVSMTLEYYNKKTTDLLFYVPSSYVTGFGSSLQNLGKMTNDGVEFSVNSTNIKNDNFSWNTAFNITYQRNKINELPNGEDISYGDGNMYLLREGESMHTFYLPQWLGVNPETGLGEFYIDPSLESRDAVVDGKLVKDGNVTNYRNKAGNTVVGSALPDVIGGITNSFSYKGFDLSFDISFQAGGSMFDYPGYFMTYSDGVRMGSFNISEEVAGNYWKQPGDVVDHPRPIFGNPYRSDMWSSRTILSTNNVRMRDITFGYKIPFKKHIKDMRVYFQAINPFYIYNANPTIDADVNVNGYRQTDTPALRSFNFGVNLTI